MTQDTAIVILAAGQGRRMGGRNKGLLDLAGRPALAYSLQAARQASCTMQVVVVMNDDDVAELQRRWSCSPADLGADLVVPGGAERWLSSAAGVRASSAAAQLVLVHDAARALVESPTFDAVARAARECGAALAAEPVADTLKRERRGGWAGETVPREGLWRAQTPQGFHREVLLEAIEQWQVDERGLPTDECMLVEALGHQARLVPSSPRNFKLTQAADWEFAQAILKSV